MNHPIARKSTYPDRSHLSEETSGLSTGRLDQEPTTCSHQQEACEIVGTSDHLLAELQQLRKTCQQIQLERDMLRKAFYAYQESLGLF